MTRHDLFISHSSADAVAARELRALLQSAGYSCWMAPDDVTGTDPWAQQILAAIDDSRAMLVLVSAQSNRSTHVAREVELASSRGRIILPFRVEAVAPAGALEYHLAGLQRIDAFPPPVGDHRAEILRRLALTVPLTSAATSAPAASSAAAIASSADVPPTSPSSSRPTRLEVGAPAPARPAGGGGLGAWARANSMVAGSIVTLAALFLVVAIGLAVNPSPPASNSPTGTSSANVPSASLLPTSAPGPSPTPNDTSAVPPSGFPVSATDEPFPNVAELALFDALPASGKSVIEACERDVNLFAGAVVGMSCHADDRELLFYQGYPDLETQRGQYLDAVRGGIGGPEGSCSTSPVGDEPWSGPDGRFGHLACGVNDLGLFMFVWTDESRLISVSWYAGYDVDLEIERAKGYQVFLNWTGG